jgi:N-acetylneuraminic acid mutarotase
MYVFGGGGLEGPMNDLYSFSLDKNEWKKIRYKNQAIALRKYQSVSLYKNKFYVFGGWDGSKRLNDLYVLNLERMMWG